MNQKLPTNDYISKIANSQMKDDILIFERRKSGQKSSNLYMEVDLGLVSSNKDYHNKKHIPINSEYNQINYILQKRYFGFLN